MTADVSSRLLLAATLAEQRAEKMTTDITRAKDTGRFVTDEPGPSHWGALAELLRGVTEVHQGFWGDGSHGCQTGAGSHSCANYAPASPCPTLIAVLPLADQIIRDLGEGR